jgi:hypothetical protein
MITETQQFFIDILKLIPIEKSSIIIRSPHEEILFALKAMNLKRENDISEPIVLNKRNREILTAEILYNNIEEFIHSLEIRVDNKKIFEGYDGMEYGMFSKEFNLTKEFKEKYTTMDMCMVSENW